jgi:hypothetical protein
MHISIEQGKTLIIRLMAVGPVIEGRAQRDVWFEVNGEVIHSRCYQLSSRVLILHRFARYPSKIRTQLLRPFRGRKQRLIPVLSVHLCQVLLSKSELKKVKRS